MSPFKKRLLSCSALLCYVGAIFLGYYHLVQMTFTPMQSDDCPFSHLLPGSNQHTHHVHHTQQEATSLPFFSFVFPLLTLFFLPTFLCLVFIAKKEKPIDTISLFTFFYPFPPPLQLLFAQGILHTKRY